jgi:hypothetical protein
VIGNGKEASEQGEKNTMLVAFFEETLLTFQKQI